MLTSRLVVMPMPSARKLSAPPPEQLQQGSSQQRGGADCRRKVQLRIQRTALRLPLAEAVQSIAHFSKERAARHGHSEVDPMPV